MAGPWEKYQPKDADSSDGPWAKFKAAPTEGAKDTGPTGLLETIDAYTGAPTRALMGAAQEGKSFKDQALAFGQQFGADPKKAPTGRSLARGLLIPDVDIPTGVYGKATAPESNPSHPDFLRYQNDPVFRQAVTDRTASPEVKLNPAAIASVPIEFSSDWTNLAAPGLGAVGKAARATELGSQAIEAAGKVMRPIKSAVGTVATKTASAISGVPEDLIKHYAKNTDRINQMMRAGGEGMEEGADALRTELQNGVRKTKDDLGKQVQAAIAKAPKETRAPVQSIIGKLEAAKSKIDPDFGKSAIDEIDEMIAIVNKKAQNGTVDMASLHSIKEGFQDLAKGSYMKSGQIFNSSPKASQAAKAAAAEARKLFNPLVPEAAKANNQLSAIHAIEADLNRNLLGPGKSSSALMAAGAGTNPRNAKKLARLGEVANVPALEGAKDLATARAFQKPSFVPTDMTGKSVARQVAAGLLGTGVAGGPGGLIAAAAASPAAVKAAINAGQMPLHVARIIANSPGAALSSGLVQKVSDTLLTPEGYALYKTLMSGTQAAGLLSQPQGASQ